MTTRQLDAPIINIDRRFTGLAASFAGGAVVHYWATSGSPPAAPADVGGTVAAFKWRSVEQPRRATETALPTIRTGTSTGWQVATQPSLDLTTALPSHAPVDALALLAAAVEANDHRAFGAALGAIDWGAGSAQDFARAVRLAMAMDAPLSARQLAQAGARRFPDHAELRTMARVLAPPRILATGLPPDPTVAADQAWFKAHSAEYYGKWVAVKNGVLLGVAESARELRQQVQDLTGAVFVQIVW